MEQQMPKGLDQEEMTETSVLSDQPAGPALAANDGQDGEGSVRYRILALVGMLLLAIGAVSLGLWSYFH